jgi:hypothetical protein
MLVKIRMLRSQPTQLLCLPRSVLCSAPATSLCDWWLLNKENYSSFQHGGFAHISQCFVRSWMDSWEILWRTPVSRVAAILDVSPTRLHLVPGPCVDISVLDDSSGNSFGGCVQKVFSRRFQHLAKERSRLPLVAAIEFLLSPVAIIVHPEIDA